MFIVWPRALPSARRSSPHRLVARTPLFQGGNRGSIPLGGVQSFPLQSKYPRRLGTDTQPSSPYGSPFELPIREQYEVTTSSWGTTAVAKFETKAYTSKSTSTRGMMASPAQAGAKRSFYRSGIAALWLVAVVTGGCGLLSRHGEEEEFAEPRSRELTLYVRNQNFYDATLYAVSQGGHRLRLGVARGNSEEAFVFRWPHLDLRIVIDFLAAGTSFTESLPVEEGDELQLIIEADSHIRGRRP